MRVECGSGRVSIKNCADGQITALSRVDLYQGIIKCWIVLGWLAKHGASSNQPLYHQRIKLWRGIKKEKSKLTCKQSLSESQLFPAAVQRAEREQRKKPHRQLGEEKADSRWINWRQRNLGKEALAAGSKRTLMNGHG